MSTSRYMKLVRCVLSLGLVTSLPATASAALITPDAPEPRTLAQGATGFVRWDAGSGFGTHRGHVVDMGRVRGHREGPVVGGHHWHRPGGWSSPGGSSPAVGVPELDGRSGAGALALVLGGVLLFTSRRRQLAVTGPR